VGDELQRGIVGPVQVVEREHHASARAQGLQQRADRAVGLEALVLQAAGGGTGEAVQPRDDRRELGGLVANQALEAIGAQRRGVIAERVDRHRERQILLQLGGTAREHEMAERIGPRAELADQARLADAGLAADRQDRRAAGLELRERLGHGGKLRAPSDERLWTIHPVDNARHGSRCKR
jgi:hypothetical protein